MVVLLRSSYLHSHSRQYASTSCPGTGMGSTTCRQLLYRAQDSGPVRDSVMRHYYNIVMNPAANGSPGLQLWTNVLHQ